MSASRNCILIDRDHASEPKEENMWLLTLGPAKARQAEFLREAERWQRSQEAKAYLSTRDNLDTGSLDGEPLASDINLGSAIPVNIEPYSQSLSKHQALEEVRIVSEE
jgi:hypothetical protein